MSEHLSAADTFALAGVVKRAALAPYLNAAHYGGPDALEQFCRAQMELRADPDERISLMRYAATRGHA